MLAERFGGATAFDRTPATGIWLDADEEATRDRIVIVEVIVPSIEIAWWRQLKARLEQQLEQEEILIREHPITVLR